ncbi:hypothetical protein CCAX7_63780 [Capsulimonas corticalis]|uniref:Uncharacterized protein n=1 Tax=Capsulimonas corticalis TaxID=2219043 RepID=A0A402CWY9_9BACT|nr:hypothetical protein CCAX7_63780 [Capsulimonas corticalis]
MIAAAAFLLVLSGCAGRAQRAREEELAREIQQSGSMSKAEAERYARLMTQVIYEDQGISGVDAQWLLSTTEAAGTSEQKYQRMQSAGCVFMALRPQRIPLAARDSVFKFAAKLATYSDPAVKDENITSFQYMACNIFRNLGDSRALPYVNLLCASTSPIVRTRARHDIRLFTHHLRPGEAP